MVRCPHCKRDRPQFLTSNFYGNVSCRDCGKLPCQEAFTEEPTIVTGTGREDGKGCSGKLLELESSSTGIHRRKGKDKKTTKLKVYLNNKEECYYKKIIWEKMNKEYLQEQAAKEAAVAACKDITDEGRTAPELAAATRAALEKLRKERRQKQASKAKNVNPNQTAAEATCQMLTKKRLSSKINYDVLEKLFNEEPASNSKRTRVESQQAINVDGKEFSDEINEAYTGNNNDEQEQENEDMEEMVGGEAYMDEWYSRNEEEVFDYGYYDGDDEY